MGAAAQRLQTEIEGTEPERIQEIEDYALPYAQKMYQRKDSQPEEKRLKEMALAAMQEKGLETYTVTDGDIRYTFTLEQKAKLKCKREKLDEDED